MAGNVSLTVRLIDLFSGPAAKVASTGDKVAASLGGVKGAGVAASSRWNNFATRVAGVTAGVAGLGVVATKFGKSISGSMRDSAEFEDMLAGIGRTGEMTDAQLASMRETILKLAPQLGRMPDQVGEVAEKLIAAGITPDRVEKMVEAKRADGTIADDFAEMDKTTLAKMRQLDAEIDVRRKRWATAATPWQNWKLDKLSQLNNWLGNLVDSYPRLGKAIASTSLGMSDLMSMAGSLSSSLLGVASTLVIGKFLGVGKVLGGIGRAVWALLLPIRFVFSLIYGMLAEAAVILGPALLRGLMALGPFIRRGLMTLFRIFTGPAGWALLAADLAWAFREPLLKAFSGVWESIKESFSLSKREALNTLAAADDGAAVEQGGREVMTKFWNGLKSVASSLLEWASGFIGQLKSLFSFSASPTITLPKGMPAPWLSPSSYKGGDNQLAPAPALQRQASVTYHNTFSISGSENPEAVAQRIVTALNRQRQSGLYDGALA